MHSTYFLQDSHALLFYVLPNLLARILHKIINENLKKPSQGKPRRASPVPEQPVAIHDTASIGQTKLLVAALFFGEVHSWLCVNIEVVEEQTFDLEVAVCGSSKVEIVLVILFQTVAVI
jgi:hypothetical protein